MTRYQGALLVLLLLGASLWVPRAQATTCTVSTASAGVAFGSYIPTSGSANTANGTLSLTCTPDCTSPLPVTLCVSALGVVLGYNGVNASIALSIGGGTSYTARLLRSGTNTLGYNLYSNSGYTTIFGNGSGGSSVVTYCFTGGTVLSCSGATYVGAPASGLGGLAGTPQTQLIPIYGRIPASQDAAVGSYSDTLTVTVTF